MTELGDGELDAAGEARARRSRAILLTTEVAVSDAELPLWEFIAADLPKMRRAVQIAVAVVSVIVAAFAVRDWLVAPAIAPVTSVLRVITVALGVRAYRGLARSDREAVASAMAFTYGFLFAHGAVVSLLPHGFAYYSTSLLIIPLGASMFLPRAKDVVRLQACLVVAVQLGLAWRPPPLAEIVAMELALLITSVATVVLGTMNVRGRHRRVRLEQRLRDEAARDALTGAYNRRYLWAIGKIEVRRARRYARPLAALAIDIDWFKRVNDAHGHEVGDRVIQATAELLGGRIRECDLLGRTGGEEFVVLLPETTAAAAVVLAERLRTATADLVVTAGAATVRWTVSIGVTELAGDDLLLEDLLRRADRALYQAKAAGRDQTQVVPAAPRARPVTDVGARVAPTAAAIDQRA